jgi:YD repeat-containing protein
VGFARGGRGYGQASGIAPTAKPHAVTHLNNAQKFWYDHNGNMTRRIDEGNSDWTYTWTIENQLANWPTPPKQAKTSALCTMRMG